jgi:putative ABC transport system ATP-binding protein/lipoprotein-releasing system ATP-binding protein
MIEGINIIKEFGSPPQRVLHGLNFKILDAEFVSISGRSGSGKSTLLYIMSTLDHPTEGNVLIDGIDLKSLNSKEIHSLRNRNIGFIFQFHYLLPELTVLENVLLPARNLGLIDTKRGYARELLNLMGIINLESRYPSQLSGGEQQRVAIARALAMKPRYLFADEPTGNLDTINANIVMRMIKDINKNSKTTVCLVTHDPDYASFADREIYLINGNISERSKDILI